MNNLIEFTPKHKPISQYAKEIFEDWKVPSPYAMPYLNAMQEINQVHDMYHLDTASSVVLYFLSNAKGWRGPAARQVKKELNAIIEDFNKDAVKIAIQTKKHKAACNTELRQ